MNFGHLATRTLDFAFHPVRLRGVLLIRLMVP